MIKNGLLICLLCLQVQVFAQGKKASNISMVLPFSSKQIRNNPNHSNAELGNICREYYQGALIALDSFERAKVAVRLAVFDTENDSMTLVKIMQKPAFKESELIIGPVMLGGNKALMQYADDKGIYHVSPLMTFSKTRLKDPFWISANPDLPSYATYIYDYIIKKDPGANIIVVADKTASGKSILGAFKTLAASNKNSKVKVVDYAAGFDITKYTSLTANNHVIVSATGESVVGAVLRAIKDTTHVNGLHTYGLQQWFDFKSIDYLKWHAVNLHFITPYYVDYTRDDVKAFVAAYRERFATEPTEAAFKGYDQMLYFGWGLSKYGKGFMKKIDDEPVKMLHTIYNYKKQKEESFQSNYLNILHLENYTLIKLN